MPQSNAHRQSLWNNRIAEAPCCAGLRLVVFMSGLRRSIKWTYLASSSTAMMQIVFLAILARIISPEAFGLVAMGSMVVRFGSYFAQLGIGQALVQRHELRSDHRSAGYIASAVLGVSFSAACWFIAPLVGSIFNSREVVDVLRVLCLSFALTGLFITPNAICRREMRFKEIAIVEMIAYAVGYGSGLLYALNGGGVNALILAALVQSAVLAVGFNILVRPGRLPFPRWKPFRELFEFGGGVSVISVLEYISENLDTLAVGRFAGAASLGVYSRGTSLVKLPMLYLSTSLSRVLMPVLSRLQHDRPRAGRAYLRVLEIVSAVGVPLAFGMSAAAEELVLTVLGVEWLDGAAVLRVGAFVVLLSVLDHFGGVLLESAGILWFKGLMRGLQITVAGCLLLIFRDLSIPWFAIAMLLAELVQFIGLTFFVVKRFALPVRSIARMYTARLADGVATFTLLLVSSIAGSWLNMPAPLVLLVQGSVGAAFLFYVVRVRGDGRLLANARRPLD